jgi:transcriptional regulator with XRE-family HTH domain
MGNMEIQALFGSNLKRLRVMRKLSQFNLSMDTGLTHNFINDVERGKKWVSSASVEKFATALNVKPYVFFVPEGMDASRAALAPRLAELSASLNNMAASVDALYAASPDEEESNQMPDAE